MKWFFSIFCLLLCLSPPNVSNAESNIARDTYVRLDQVLKQKKGQLLELFDHVQKKADHMKNDEIMHNFFFFMNELNNQGVFEQIQGVPPALKELIDDYSRSIDQFYLQNYLEFYDILLVNKSGDIFYTIRKEDDFRQNIYSSHLSSTRVAQQLIENPNTFFVDYQYYSPADEPAAFFIVPMVREGVHEGWILMQYAINKLNMLMVDYRELGNSGEVYLVNQDHLLLTNSRFKAGDSSLKLRVETDAVKSAFLIGQGHKLINGYHGTKVFTSFEKFSLWGAQWAIIASIEEEEIITNYYLQNRDVLDAPLFERLASQNQENDRQVSKTGKVKKVDIDESKKAEEGTILQTRGVSACTAVVVEYPEHFAYLAHISPFDKIYGLANLTNQIKDLVGRIKHNDIYLKDLGNLKFIVVANHLNSIKTIIDKLTRYGIRLEQITFAYNPDAYYANVTSSGNGQATYIEWVLDSKTGRSYFQNTGEIENLSRAIMNVSGYSGKH
jgi:hypothetical protein